MGVLNRRQTASLTTTAPSSSTTGVTSPPLIYSSQAFYSRTGHCSVVKDSVLYVFGGLPGGTNSNNPKFPPFIALNLTSAGLYGNPPMWQVLSDDGAVPVTNGQCVLIDTHLIVVGGTPINSALLNPFAPNTTMTYCGLQAYSFAQQGWQSLMPQTINAQTVFLNLNRTGHAVGWFENVGNGQPGLFVFGGVAYNATTPANDAFVISPFTIPELGGQPIIEANSIPSNLPPPLNNAGAAVVDDATSVVVFGGTTTGSGELNTIWEYSPKTTTWRQLPVQLPHAMPNAKTGWVDPHQNLFIVDVSTANPQDDTIVVSLANAGLRRRDLTQSTAPANLDGASVAFDTDLNLAIVSGGSNTFDYKIFNITSNTWVENVYNPPNTTTTSATGTVSLQTGTGSAIKGQSTGFNKANLLAPIILGGILGLLGLLGIILLIISYRHRKATQHSKKGKGHASAAAGLWLKYGNQKQPRDPNEDPYSKALGGEIFLQNLEEKHGLKRAPTDRRKTGWSKYFSTGWYHSSSNNAQRASASTSGTARALVNETRDHNGPYGGGWDAESRYSKASSFFSVISVNDGKDMSSGQWDRVSWSEQRKTRASNASSGVLGSTIDVPSMPIASAFGAGGVRKI